MAAAKRCDGQVFELTPLEQSAPQVTAQHKALPRSVHQAARVAARVPLDQAPFPEVFELIVQVLEDVNTRLPEHCSPQEAAKRQAVALCHYLGGRRVWWPTPGRIAGLVRDWLLYHREFTGNNAHELAKRHRIPLETLYRRLKRMRQHHLSALRRGRVPAHERANQNSVSGQRRGPTGV